ncbi:MAG TPA: methyltransferase [Thermomicrobiales bacterium]|nr:methyltransferase [Thermomicrobiales bacterium]
MTVRERETHDEIALESNPFDTVLRMAGDYCLPRCLHVVADLGVADVLDETPRTSAALAADVGANPDALGRVLRLLAANGVFVSEGDTFHHSPTSRLLRADHPQSLRAFVRMLGLPINWSIYGELEYAVRTGLPAVNQVYPDGLWAYYAQHPEAGQVFSAAMVSKAHGQIAGILASYDFSSFQSIGDIGGGTGHLLRAVLSASPSSTGVLFDLENVIAEAASIASDRLALQAGDFFRDRLPICDAYLLMEVIHDWADAEALAILQAIRRSAPPHARLLLIEAIVPNDPGPNWPKQLDIHMLAMVGGRQRTQQEYETLLEQAGFVLLREIDTHAGASILEAAVN